MREATHTSATAPITADRDRCVGAGQCVLVAPRLFDQADDGQVIVLDRRPSDDLMASAREAVDLCPGRALRLGA